MNSTTEHSGIITSFESGIGNTPLIRMSRLSEMTGCEIFGKAEFLNPGGSVKDRAALWMIREHEKSGALAPGGTVVEGTAGNTGIGIAHVCNARGYNCIIYMPDTQSPEKVAILRTLGAEVREVPAVPYRDEMNYQKQAGRFAESLPGAVWANQFDNPANRLAHYESTGPEIWSQTDGQIDAFVAATGTGGTLAGVSRYLKEQRRDVQIVLADPMGSALHGWVTTGEATMSKGSSITEGIGNSRVTDNLAGTEIDDAVQVADQDMVNMVYQELLTEGWFFGSSTGINLCAAVAVAKKLGPGHRIVTILCDSGHKYQSRLFNEAFLAEKGLKPWKPQRPLKTGARFSTNARAASL
jgi:cysteine synthase A